MSKTKTKSKRLPNEITWIVYKPRGLEFTRKTAPPFGEAEMLVLGMDQEIDSGGFWRGALYLQLMKWYGEEKVMQIFGPRTAWKTWQNNASVCSRVPFDVRREEPAATYSHHAEVAYLADKLEKREGREPTESEVHSLQTHYLQMTVENDLTVRQLRDLIKADFGELEEDEDDVRFKKRPPVERMVGIRQKIENLIEDLPDDWYAESALLDTAFGNMQSAIESANNREIGEPALVDVEAIVEDFAP